MHKKKLSAGFNTEFQAPPATKCNDVMITTGEVIKDPKNIRSSFMAIMTVNAHYVHFFRYDGVNKNIDMKQRIISIEFS